MRQERVAVFLLVGVAIAVIVAHLVLAGLGKEPFARPFNNNSADGELVVVEGMIDQITLTKSGGHMTVSVNNLSVFLPAQVVQGAGDLEAVRRQALLDGQRLAEEPLGRGQLANLL